MLFEGGNSCKIAQIQKVKLPPEKRFPASLASSEATVENPSSIKFYW